MKAALDAALDRRATLVFADESSVIGETIALLRAAPLEPGLILLVIASTVPKLDRALLLAAAGPIAAEVATERRIAALDLADGCELADVVAAAIFLADAHSTTGQTLRITPRG